jgi:uncharacterized protein (DUF2147 family)
MLKHAPQLAICFAALTAAASARAAADITGVWIDHTGRGAVDITECGANLCGRLVCLKDGGHKSVCGTQIIGNAKPAGKDTWDGGWIYDPEKNAKYSVELKPIGSDKLRVLGYMGSKMFSETMIWKRPTTELKRCDDAAPEKTAAPFPSEKRATPPPADDQPPNAPASDAPKASTTAKGQAARQPEKETDCKKYFPQTGDMISVPCPR